MTMTSQAVYSQLAVEGLAGGDAPPPAPSPVISPWYVRVMLGVAGWVAGALMVGFFSSLFALLLRNSPAMIVLGIGLCAGAFFFYKLDKGEVVDQIGLATSMCGQLLFGWGVVEAKLNGTDAAYTIAIFQLVLALVMPNFLHRVLSTWFACGALFVALFKPHALGAGAIVVALPVAALWLLEARWRATRFAEAFSAITWGLTFALLVWPLYAHLPESMRQASWIPSALGPGLALVALAGFASRDAGAGSRLAAFVGAAALGWAARDAPGVLACAVVLLAGYRAGSRALVMLAALGVLGYLTAYYYQLNITLLAKSQALALIGVAFLVVGAAMHWMPRKEAR